MTANATQQHKNIGKTFNIKTSQGFVEMECIEWTSENRAFKSEKGFLEMDWMEYLDQVSLGRIVQL